jgi:hypothetical protein
MMDAKIEELAKQAGGQLESFMTNPPRPLAWHFSPEALERFANLLVKPTAQAHALGVPAMNTPPGDWPAWIKHEGGQRPVEPFAVVDVIYRGDDTRQFDVDSYLASGFTADTYQWTWEKLPWHQEGDIVAYRVRP